MRDFCQSLRRLARIAKFTDHVHQGNKQRLPLLASTTVFGLLVYLVVRTHIFLLWICELGRAEDYICHLKRMDPLLVVV